MQKTITKNEIYKTLQVIPTSYNHLGTHLEFYDDSKENISLNKESNVKKFFQKSNQSPGFAKLTKIPNQLESFKYQGKFSFKSPHLNGKLFSVNRWVGFKTGGGKA